MTIDAHEATLTNVWFGKTGRVCVSFHDRDKVQVSLWFTTPSLAIATLTAALAAIDQDSPMPMGNAASGHANP